MQRVVFYEITQSAVKEAVAHPREISIPLVNAQQARRALDYLVGFNLSPLLWRKIRPGLSAGRVQSPALRLIVERELEIEKFKTQEYWSVHLDSQKNNIPFTAKLFQYQGKKLEQLASAAKQNTTRFTPNSTTPNCRRKWCASKRRPSNAIRPHRSPLRLCNRKPYANWA